MSEVKKVIFVNSSNEIIAVCPVCGKFVSSMHNIHFCGSCGERLDWRNVYAERNPVRKWKPDNR